MAKRSKKKINKLIDDIINCSDKFGVYSRNNKNYIIKKEYEEYLKHALERSEFIKECKNIPYDIIYVSLNNGKFKLKAFDYIPFRLCIKLMDCEEVEDD